MLYVSSGPGNQLYTHPQIPRLACSILIYRIGRALTLAQRRQMTDDPPVFALKDRQSLGCSAAMLALFVAAS